MLRRTFCLRLLPHLTAAMSTQPVKVTQLSSNLTLDQNLVNPAPVTQSLVLFFPFLNSSEKAQTEYKQLYLQRGHHVLTVHTQLQQFVRPSLGRNIAHELLNYLISDPFPLQYNRIFVHSMSIGAFVYTIVMDEMLKSKKFNTVHKKIVGQVFDSLTLGGLDHMVYGIASKATNPLIRFMITSSVNAYFAVTRPWTVAYFNCLVDLFKDAPVHKPALIIYGENDALICLEDMQQMIDKWRGMEDQDFQVFVQKWPVSKHAYHLRVHSEDYKAALSTLLVRVGLESMPAHL